MYGFVALTKNSLVSEIVILICSLIETCLSINVLIPENYFSWYSIENNATLRVRTLPVYCN